MQDGIVWVIGNRGMLGQELCKFLNQKGIPYVGSDLEVSILDPEALLQFGKEWVQAGGTTISNESAPAHKSTPSAYTTPSSPPFPWIVNCAAYTAVDKAEDEPEKCFALNAEGPRNIARVAEELRAGLIHISTDYVFDGRGITDGAGDSTAEGAGRGEGTGTDDGIGVVEAAGTVLRTGSPRPYREEDPVHPIGVYGKSKATGEEEVLNNCSRAVILRTAWLYGKYGNNFVYTMLHLMQEREVVRVVADQRGSPTWAADLAEAILHILCAHRPQYGIFHFTNDGECSWYEFACEIYRLGRERGLLSKECRLEPITTAEYPTRARRPQYSVLSKEKIRKVYGVSVPPWQSSLKQFMLTILK